MKFIRFTTDAVARAAVKYGIADLADKIVREGGRFDGQYYWETEATLRSINPDHPALKTPAVEPEKWNPDEVKLICEKCVFLDPRDDGGVCIDKDCGCYRSEQRQNPWLNRQFKCRFWGTLKPIEQGIKRI